MVCSNNVWPIHHGELMTHLTILSAGPGINGHFQGPSFSGDRSSGGEDGELRNRRSDVYILGRGLPRDRVCWPLGSGGAAMVCWGGAVIDFVRRWTEEVGFLLLRLLFPLLAVVVAGV